MLGLLMAALLWFLPARWVLPWLQPHLHGVRLQQVHGSVWDGEAATVTSPQGQRWGRLQWQLSRRLLLGQARAQLQFDGPQLTFSAAIQRLPDGRIDLHDLRLHAELAGLDLPMDTVLGPPGGTLQASAAHAVLQGGWPLQLQAQAHWQHASLHLRDGVVALGDLQLQAQAQGGVIRAQMHDDGHGPLQVDGQLQLSPLGWRLDATLRARQTDPLLLRWLGRLGPRSSDGSVHVQRRGGLAGQASVTSSTRETQRP